MFQDYDNITDFMRHTKSKIKNKKKKKSKKQMTHTMELDSIVQVHAHTKLLEAIVQPFEGK